MEHSQSHSLRVQLVERPIHADGDFEEVQAAVLADLVHHSSHASAAELGRAPRHHRAHLLDNDAVIARGLQAQVLQDGAHLEQGQAVAGEDTSMDSVRRWSSWDVWLPLPELHPAEPRDSWLG